MKKRYLIILVGLILVFAALTGCGTKRRVQQTQTSDSSITQREEELQADSGSSTQSSSGNTGNTSGVAVTLEEAQGIALERVPGATAQNISIELDEDDGWYIYEGDIVYDGMEYEFEIDANSGNILKWEEERW